MLAEDQEVLDLDDPRRPLLVLLPDVRQDLDLGVGLARVLLLVADDLQGHQLLLLVVEGLEDPAIGPFPEDPHQLVAVRDVVPDKTPVVVAEWEAAYLLVEWASDSSFLSLCPM